MNKNNSHIETDSDKFWMTLDNAAKIFPAVMNRELTTVFRLTAVLKHKVNITALMRATAKTEQRYPYFLVQMKEGFFWFYLELLPNHISIKADKQLPCRHFPRNGLMIRLLVKENRINLECSHVLTDGGGAMQFLKTLLTFYQEELDSNKENKSPLPSEIPAGEYEDSYKKYFREEIPPMVSRSRAFHLPFALNAKPRFRINTFSLPLEQVKKAAEHWSVTITDFLVATYMCSLQEIFEKQQSGSKQKQKKHVRVQVPVNLRNIFPSQSMRNFSLFVMPEIDLRLGHYNFDEILKAVYHQIRLETDEKLINKNISRNVGSEKKIYVKSIPLFLKSLILKINYYTKGTNQYSGVVTNLGKIKLPEETDKIVDHFVFTPPPPNKILKVGCGIIGFHNKLVISFANITKSDQLEETFMSLLKKHGIESEKQNY